MNIRQAAKICYGGWPIRSATIPPASDLDRYNAAQARLRAVLGEHGVWGIDTAEYQTAWQEIERIKNKNGGMPPKPTEQG